MKVAKGSHLFLIVAAICAIAPVASAVSVDFTPPSPGWDEMPHNEYYAWGIEWELPEGHSIASAELTFYGINDYSYDSDDVLFVRLVDDLPNVPWSSGSWPGMMVGNDTWFGPPSDALAGSGIPLGQYEDPNRWVLEDWTIVFDAAQRATLESYLANDNIFGITADPDCHYGTCGVLLTLTTEPGEPPIPEPVTIAGLLIGLSSLGGYLRRRTLI